MDRMRSRGHNGFIPTWGSYLPEAATYLLLQLWDPKQSVVLLIKQLFDPVSELLLSHWDRDRVSQHTGTGFIGRQAAQSTNPVKQKRDTHLHWYVLLLTWKGEEGDYFSTSGSIQEITAYQGEESSSRLTVPNRQTLTARTVLQAKTRKVRIPTMAVARTGCQGRPRKLGPGCHSSGRLAII